jgi:hypothetical protein
LTQLFQSPLFSHQLCLFARALATRLCNNTQIFKSICYELSDRQNTMNIVISRGGSF